MNIVEQLKSAADTGFKIAATITIASVVVILAHYFWPNTFDGLPEYVVPFFNVAALFFGAVTFIPVIVWLAICIGKVLRTIGAGILAPFRKWSLKKRLLDLDEYELAVMCVALASHDRKVRLMADNPTTLSLLDRGLIEFWFHGNHEDVYHIHMNAWRAMQSMREFQISSNDSWQYAVQGRLSHAKLRYLLPKDHPSTPK